jgi:hypothetical protein
LAEHLTFNQGVPRSSRGWLTIVFKLSNELRISAHLCGSGSGVEHRLAKARVAGLNPVFRSKKASDRILTQGFPLKGLATVDTVASEFRLLLQSYKGHNRVFCSTWRGGRVVEGSGLENRRVCKGSVGSNPTLSAIRIQ